VGAADDPAKAGESGGFVRVTGVTSPFAQNCTLSGAQGERFGNGRIDRSPWTGLAVFQS